MKNNSSANQRSQFETMGTNAELLLRASPYVAKKLFDDAQAELARLQRKFTRFDPNSPMEQLNDRGQGSVDDEIRTVLGASLAAHRDTGGRVDVCIGADLIAAGYDRHFKQLDVPSDEEIAEATLGGEPAWTLLSHARAAREPGYEIHDDGTVHIREGVRIDLGGIVKGWAADQICAMLAPAGSCAVNLGGDMAIYVVDGDEPFPIGVDLVTRTLSYDVARGGWATSGQDRRVWRVAAGDNAAGLAHHIIDPRTGSPADTDILRVSVFGETCLQSEIWAKALFLQGCQAAQLEADERGIPAIIVGMDGRARFTGGLEDDV